MRSLERAEAAVQGLEERVDAWFDGEWAAYREAVEDADLGLLEGSGL